MNANVRVNVEPANPGQFFACCGLLEWADRLFPGAEGWFEQHEFCLRTDASSQKQADLILKSLVECELTNTMTVKETARFDELGKFKGSARTPALAAEREALEKLRRENPIVLTGNFRFQIDWFLDDFAGGSRFKTWAGRQSVLDIATAMKQALNKPSWASLPTERWFSESDSGGGLPFNFDSDLGGQGSAIDLGFSFDPLASSSATRIESTARPLLELLAFIGLQRFRPRQLGSDNRFLYCLWNQPYPIQAAAPAASGFLATKDDLLFEFRLLYRTKYLKSFLPAVPFSGDLHE